MLNFSLLAGLTYVFNDTMSRLVIGSVEHVKLLFWACCAQFFSSISYYYLTYFRNSEVATKFTFYTIASSLINLVISLFLVAYLRIGVIGIVYAQLCAGIMVFGIVGSQFDKYMVGHLASIGGAGIYSIGQRIAYFIFTFMTSIEKCLFSTGLQKNVRYARQRRRIDR